VGKKVLNHEPNGDAPEGSSEALICISLKFPLCKGKKQDRKKLSTESVEVWLVNGSRVVCSLMSLATKCVLGSLFIIGSNKKQ
jgi:hypothetical protein